MSPGHRPPFLRAVLRLADGMEYQKVKAALRQEVAFADAKRLAGGNA